MGFLYAGMVDAYLERIGLDPASVRGADRDRETLARLQSAHVQHVPFENLSIIGDPFTDDVGPGISLDLDDIYEKVVETNRGGYCFELNGLFHTLLDALGYDVHRAAAMVLPDDDEPSTPANHHVNIVSLEEEYVVDVGMGSPQMRQPTSLAGDSTTEDDAGVRWRVSENDRPTYGLTTQYQRGDQDWEPRYIFDPSPREFSYFAAANDFLSTAPESPFTENTIVRRDTADGWLELGRETFVRVTNGERTEETVTRDEWYDRLETAFDLTIPD